MWNKLNTTPFLNNENIQPQWFVIDASKQIVGRLASKVAMMLKGKDDGSYTPHVSGNKRFIIINAKNLVFTGNKLETKVYYKHTQQVGHLKIRKAKDIMQKNPAQILYNAIQGMLKKTRLRKEIMKHVHIYDEGDHNHSAQRPENMSI